MAVRRVIKKKKLSTRGFPQRKVEFSFEMPKLDLITRRSKKKRKKERKISSPIPITRDKKK